MGSNPIQTLVDGVVEGGQVGVVYSIVELIREQHETAQPNVGNVGDVFGINTLRAVVGGPKAGVLSASRSSNPAPTNAYTTFGLSGLYSECSAFLESLLADFKDIFLRHR